MKNFYGNANRFKTKEELYVILRKHRKRLLKYLEEDRDPFIDNTEFHQNKMALQAEKKLPVEIIK